MLTWAPVSVKFEARLTAWSGKQGKKQLKYLKKPQKTKMKLNISYF